MYKNFRIGLSVVFMCAASILRADVNRLDDVTRLEKKESSNKSQNSPNSYFTPTQEGSLQSEKFLSSQSCPDAWKFSGAFLYLLPTLDDTYFVLNANSSTSYPSGTRMNNDFGFKPAFRVGAEYSCCNRSRAAQAFFTQLNGTQDKTVAGPHLSATIGTPPLTETVGNYSGTASAKLDLLYNNLDVNLSQKILNIYGMNLYIQPGLEYAYFRLKEDYTYEKADGNLAVIDQESKAWGLGPQIGLGLEYNLFQRALFRSSTQALSISSLFSGSILMGTGKINNLQYLGDISDLENKDIEIDTKDESTWKTIPGLHARVGLNYLIRGAKYGFIFGVGYEFNTYVRALTRIVFPDDVAENLCTTNYYNFDVQGFNFSAAVSF